MPVEGQRQRGYRFVAPVSRAGIAEVTAVEAPVPSRRVPVLALALASALVVVAGTLWIRNRTESEAPLKAVPLTSYPGYESEPSFSPDGKQVAFAWKGEKGDNWDIYVQLIGSGRPLRLTTDPARDFSPSWSPDGQSIAFVRWDSGNNASLLRVPALGGAEREVAQLGTMQDNPNIGGWTPDGRSLVVSVKEGDRPYGLFLFSMESGERRRLTSPPAGMGGDPRSRISPDGRTLAFMRLPTSAAFPADVYTLGLTPDFVAKGEPKRLTFFSAPNTGGMAWTSDSREIVFAASSGGPLGLWRMPVSGSEKPRAPCGWRECIPRRNLSSCQPDDLRTTGSTRLQHLAAGPDRCGFVPSSPDCLHSSGPERPILARRQENRFRLGPFGAPRDLGMRRRWL